jgi:hypothetical protein
MGRFPPALLSLVCFLSSASASLTPRPDATLPGRVVPASLAMRLPPGLAQAALAYSPQDQYQITDRTEVTLDGRPCR